MKVRHALLLTVLCLVLLVGCGSQKQTTVTCGQGFGSVTCTRTDNSSGKADGVVQWAKDNMPLTITLGVLGLFGLASLVDKSKPKTPDKS